MTSEQLPPLDIKCTSADCENGLHCFRPKRGMDPDHVGNCRECDVALVDWGRLHKRDLSDLINTLEALELEMFRHHMWHIQIPDRMTDLARKAGPDTLRDRLHNSVDKALRKGARDNPWDGRQTPRETSSNARVHHLAQHATATCCRKCLEYWHGIDKGERLTDEQVDYCASLAWEYIERRGIFT